MTVFDRFRGCTRTRGCLERRNHGGPCFTGAALVWPSKPAPVMTLEQAMHGASPNFPEGIPLAPGICDCKLCASTHTEPSDGAK